MQFFKKQNKKNMINRISFHACHQRNNQGQNNNFQVSNLKIFGDLESRLFTGKPCGHLQFKTTLVSANNYTR